MMFQTVLTALNIPIKICGTFLKILGIRKYNKIYIKWKLLPYRFAEYSSVLSIRTVVIYYLR